MRQPTNKTEGAPAVAEQRVVRHTGTARSIVKEIMFLFGVEYVPTPKFEKAAMLVADKWKQGYEDGVAHQKSKPALCKKIKAILRGKQSVPNH